MDDKTRSEIAQAAAEQIKADPDYEAGLFAFHGFGPDEDWEKLAAKIRRAVFEQAAKRVLAGKVI